MRNEMSSPARPAGTLLTVGLTVGSGDLLVLTLLGVNRTYRGC